MSQTTQEQPVALTLAPSPFLPPGMDMPSFGGGVITAVFSILTGALWLRRKYSKDGTEISREDSEISLLKTLQAERDKAMAAAGEAWVTRAQDAMLIGELTSKVNHLTELNEALRKEIQDFRLELHELRKHLCTASECPRHQSQVVHLMPNV